MTVSVRTMACRSCLELVDVVTQVHSVAGRDAPMRLHVCPVCDSVDLAPWGQVESYEDLEGGFTRRKEPEPGESWGECPKCAGPEIEGDVWDHAVGLNGAPASTVKVVSSSRGLMRG